MRAPIRVRLTAVYCIVFCCSTVILELGAYWGFQAAIYAVVDNDLRSRLKGVTDFLNEHVVRMPLPRLQHELENHEALQPEHLSIAAADGSSVFRGAAFLASPPQPAEPGRGKAPAPVAVATWTSPGTREPIRILATRRRIQGRDFDLLLATGLAVPFGIMRQARLVLLFSAPVLLLFASLVGYWISGRALAPVSELTRAARSIGAANLSLRVAVPSSGDEIQELAVTLNDMLTRIDDTFRHVTQFTANASHELRTPLALIRTTSEVALLYKGADAASYRAALHRILSEAETNTALLDNLLLLARADAGGRILDRRPVDIAAEIRQTCEHVELLATEKRLRLQVDAGTEPLWVSGNSDHLRRLWLILLDNAVKYTPAGGEISVTAGGAGPDLVYLEVSDTGIGIAPADLPRIHERFFRADAARTKRAGGSGLGLSIARCIVEAHDATISVRSKVGEGATFRIVFPRSHSGLPSAAPAAALLKV